MIILKDNTYTQNIKFIPRSEDISLMVFTDELSNVSFEIKNPTLVKNSYFLQFETNLDFEFLVDGHTYTFECFDVDGVPLYRDKIMCTNQTIKDYTINNGDYVANQTTKEYVIYE